MIDLDKKDLIEYKQFGILLLIYNSAKSEVTLKKMTQQGDFWDFEWEKIHKEPHLFWDTLTKKDALILKEGVVKASKTERFVNIEWKSKNTTNKVCYHGIINNLFVNPEGDTFLNLTVFKEPLIDTKKEKELDSILNLVNNKVDRIGGDMYIVSDVTSKEIKYVNQNTLLFINQSKSEVESKKIDDFYKEYGFVFEIQKDLTYNDTKALACFTPPQKGVKWIEIILLNIKSENGVRYRVDVIYEVSSKVINSLRNSFFSKIISLHNKQYDFNGFVKTLVDATVEFNDIDVAELWVVNYNEQFLKLRYSAVSDKSLMPFQTVDTFKIGEGLPSACYKKRAITYFDNLTSSKLFLRSDEAKELGLNSAVCLPLLAGDRMLGVLVIVSKKLLNQNRSSWFFNSEIGSAIGWSIFYKRREYDFKSFFNFAPQIHAIIGSDGFIKKINPAFFEMTGFNINILQPSKYIDFIHPEDVSAANDYFKKVFSGEQLNNGIDIRVVDKYSNYKIINWRAILDTSQEEVAFLFGEDKTELREQQNLIKKSTEMALMGNWVYDGKNNTITISKPLADLLEHEGDLCFTEDKWFSFLEDSTSSKKLKNLIEYAIQNESSWDTFLRIKTGKGSIKWVRSMGWINGSGHNKTLQGSIQDIHDFKAKQLKLENKTKYLHALSKINEALLDTDSWSSTINICLKIIGSTLNIDRTYYFDYCYDDLNDGYVFTHLFEWVKEGIRPQINDLELKNVKEEDIEPATTTIKSGNLFIGHTQDMENTKFKSFLIDASIKSIFILPVFINNQLQGQIGMDSCKKERFLGDEELEFFTTAVQNISIAFDKFHITDDLQNALEEKEYILESIQDGFFAMDEDYKVIYWNNKAEAIFKKPKIEIIEEYIFEVFEDEEFNELNDYFETANSLERALNFELYFKRLSCWLEFNVYTNSKGLSVYFRDITEKILSFEKLTASNERFKLISDASNDAIWEWNLENDTLTWGDGFQRNFGIDLGSEKPTLETWTERIHKEDLPTVLKTLKNAIKSNNENKFYVRYRFLRDDGTYAYVIDRSSIIRNHKGVALKMVGAITDFSRIIEYENSLKELNITLNKRADELAAINKELEQFAYVASHDLQEPLRMVSSFLKRLNEKYATELDEKGKKYIEFAVDGAERMRKIITDLLTYSRLINYEGFDEEIDVNALLQEILLENRKLISDKSAQVNMDVLPVIRSCRTPLKQIFGNLLNNAIKYTEDHKESKVHISCKDNMTHWLFEITDNGIGIEKEYYDKIFIIFQRLHEQSSHKGSGLGLSIVKKVVEKLGGEIWVKSEPGEGSVFSFTIEKR